MTLTDSQYYEKKSIWNVNDINYKTHISHINCSFTYLVLVFLTPNQAKMSEMADVWQFPSVKPTETTGDVCRIYDDSCI